MDTRVQACIEEMREIIECAKQAEKERVLREIGLCGVHREYAKTHFSSFEQARAAGFTNWERKDGVAVYYRDVNNEDITVTDEELEQIIQLKKEMDLLAASGIPGQETADKRPIEETEFLLAPNNRSGSCYAYKFLRNLMWVAWICGAAIALLFFVTNIRHNFGYALSMTFAIVCAFAMVGAGCKCMAELFWNIQLIASSLSGMTVKKQQ